MGLLDFVQTPEGQGLLGAIGSYAATARRGTPINNIGRGVLGGVMGYQNAQENALVDQMKQAQIDQFKKAQAEKVAQQAVLDSSNAPPEVKARLLPYNDWWKQQNPEPAKPQLVEVADPKDSLRTIKKWMRPGETEGAIVGYGSLPEILDPRVQEAKRSIAKAGSPNVSVTPKIEVKTGESVASQVGPMMKDARIAADGAVKMFDSADRIEKAIESGLVSAGPLTSLTMPVKQFFAGSTDNVRQTRQVIKSLAQMSVEARKQLAGQGQVTESEAAAVAKADAGDINDLTVGELRDLVTLTKRASHFTAKSYQEQLGNLGSNEGTKGLVPFYNVRGMEPLLQHTPQLPQIGGRPSLDSFRQK